MARNIWVTSDTHFGHSNIIKYCQRPFASSEEMDEALADNWRKTIKNEDIVYHLGDVYFGKRPEFLKRLPGRKRLILGNHDNGKDQFLQQVFEKILVWRQWPEFGLLLTHVPVHASALNVKWPRNVHGHIHEKQSPAPEYVNVSVEQTNYTPINIEELRVKNG
jgi:calcineurin-like phosphoesterase family protein